VHILHTCPCVVTRSLTRYVYLTLCCMLVDLCIRAQAHTWQMMEAMIRNRATHGRRSACFQSFTQATPPLSAPVAQPMASTPACGSPVRCSISICRAAWSLKLRARGTQSHPPSLVRSLSTYPCLYLSHSHALCCVDSHARARAQSQSLVDYLFTPTYSRW